MLAYVGENAKEIGLTYGNVAPASIGAIQRALLALEEQGGDRFFGEPALDLFDFMQTDANGRGFVNILAADRLMTSPRLYSTLLLWLLSELFERLPEAGDLPKPKLVFFFDEAHLLFDDAPDALLTKIEQVVRLIRSKGVGVYFVTQNPIDIPDTVLGQCGNKVQHALRAYTPREQKAVKAMAETFRVNPGLDVETVVTELKVGEALVSLLQADGSPGDGRARHDRAAARTHRRDPCRAAAGDHGRVARRRPLRAAHRPGVRRRGAPGPGAGRGRGSRPGRGGDRGRSRGREARPARGTACAAAASRPRRAAGSARVAFDLPAAEHDGGDGQERRARARQPDGQAVRPRHPGDAAQALGRRRRAGRRPERRVDRTAVSP